MTPVYPPARLKMNTALILVCTHHSVIVKDINYYNNPVKLLDFCCYRDHAAFMKIARNTQTADMASIMDNLVCWPVVIDRISSI